MGFVYSQLDVSVTLIFNDLCPRVQSVTYDWTLDYLDTRGHLLVPVPQEQSLSSEIEQVGSQLKFSASILTVGVFVATVKIDMNVINQQGISKVLIMKQKVWHISRYEK